MLSRIERLLIALMLAPLFAGVTLMIAQAKTQPLAAAQNTAECGVCHPQFLQAWQGGTHGQANADPVYIEAWSARGKPGACLVCHTTGYDPGSGTWKAEGVACEACHSPIPTNHPTDPMPVDKSTDLCGTCHSDTRFGWRDWKVSAHYQRNMTCTVCHDPHSASLKTVSDASGLSSADSASELCVNCHREFAMNFSYSTHHKEGLACVDCHLRHLEMGEREAHTAPDHSFNANLSTCNVCHAQQMHGATGEASTETAKTPKANTPAQPDMRLSSVTPEPKPVSPLGFAGLAGLIGLAVGMILSPWLERLYRHLNKSSGGENHE